MLDYSVLDQKRRGALPKFEELRSDFYLAGGTALALQMGHRDSVDFDFFTEREFDTTTLYERVKTLFGGVHEVLKTQEARNTLSVLVEGEIRISFFSYPYSLLEPCIEDEYLRVASIRDIGCMKLSAVVSRSSRKDYVDLYFILKRIPLYDLLASAAEKMPDLDRNLILKSLVYFGDIQEEPIRFKNQHEISLKEIELFLTSETKKAIRMGAS